jgi:hypothetical protein
MSAVVTAPALSPTPSHVDNNVTAQLISIWMAPLVGVILLGAFLAFPGFLPPMSPNMSASQVASFFDEHRVAIRFSMIVFDLCGIMLVPFFMVIVTQMKRMATPSEVFAYAYLAAVTSGATLFAVSNLLWLLAAFRPERDPALVQLLNDLAWLIFTAPVGMLVAQCICLALAIYLDAQPRPVFPRWVGHLNLVTAVLMAPAAAAAVVTSGPFAWDGLVSFWLKIGSFSVLLCVMFVVALQAVRRQAREAVASP